jgi:hypothetical protein
VLANKTIPLIIFSILQSLAFYFLVIGGGHLYFDLQWYILNPGEGVSGNAMGYFSYFMWGCLIVLTVLAALKLFRKTKKSKLIIGMIVSFFVYIPLPFFYRFSGGGWIDFGPLFDSIVLMFSFWIHSGVFYIVSLALPPKTETQ